MGEVANSIGLQAVVGAIARTTEADFDLERTLQGLAELAQGYAGARGVSIERTGEDPPGPQAHLVVGELVGTPRRLPIISSGKELGFIAIYGASMFGPATADRTQVLADLASLAMARAAAYGQQPSPTLDEARYRLITGVGHNLRNTLGAASGYMQLVEMEGPLAGAQHEYIGRSRRALGAAISLISDLIEVTRADAGKLTFDREPVSVNALVREAVRKHSDTAKAKGCEIKCDVPDKSPVIMTDSSYMQQIVDVMVYNAVRYTRPEMNVEVLVDLRRGRRSSDPPNWVCVAVTDKGTGVREAEQVFEEVHRVEQAHGNVRFKLAICRRVARLLGGDLMLDTQKDVGSTFTLWLPAPSPH